MTSYEDKPWLKSYDAGVPETVEIPKNQTFKDVIEEGVARLPAQQAIEPILCHQKREGYIANAFKHSA